MYSTEWKLYFLGANGKYIRIYTEKIVTKIIFVFTLN